VAQDLSMAALPIGFTIIMRLEMPNTPGAFGALAGIVGDAGGIIGAVDMYAVGKSNLTRDVTVTVPSEGVAHAIRTAVEGIDGVRVVFVSDSTFLAHIGGKIRIGPKIPVKTRQDLSTVYTPGVARVSMAIAADPAKAFQLTIKTQLRKSLRSMNMVAGRSLKRRNPEARPAVGIGLSSTKH